jgi:N-acyl-D-amino-acid deacylase
MRNTPLRTTLPLLALQLFSAAALLSQETTLIRNATIIDGTGAAARQGSLRISGDRIQAVGTLQPRAGERVIDATGLVLAPGFIDMHNHSDQLDRELNASSQISQGITTILVGQDGGSQWPIAEYLAKRRAAPASLNLQTLVGHATVRKQVMGQDYKRIATAAEISRMAELVDQAMRDGAVGMSSGLEYEVGSYSNIDELIAMSKAVSKYGGLYISHVRDEGDQALESFREEIRIGEEAHLPVQISHIKLGTAAVWGKADDVIRLVEAARKRGVDVTADCYPYDAWGSGLTVLVLDKRYDDPASVAKGLADVGGPENVTITSCAAHRDYEGKTLAAIAKEQSVTAVALYSKIVQEGGAGIVCKAMKDADIRKFYQQPWVMVGSDGGIGMRHPRGAGTYPRILGVFVRDRGWLTLPEAIQKMTSAPAARLKLKDRGAIKEGAFADLVLFNAQTVRDRATFAEPTLLSTGIEKVFVNGELVWNELKPTGLHPGRVLQ